MEVQILACLPRIAISFIELSLIKKGLLNYNTITLIMNDNLTIKKRCNQQ